MIRRRDPPPPLAEALGDRVRRAAEHTGGTMRVEMLVADEVERAEVEHILRETRARGARLVRTITREEDDARWERHRASTAARPRMVRRR